MAKYEVVKDFVDKENDLEYVAAGTIIEVAPERAKELSILGLVKPFKGENKAKTPTTAKKAAQKT